jgi:hypothetical protein
MSHPEVPCACCFELTTLGDPRQKKTHWFNCGGNCRALVCSNCRKNSGKLPHTQFCGWCKQPGSCESFQFPKQAQYINENAKEWERYREHFSYTSLMPYIRQIYLNLLRFRDFRRIKFYEFDSTRNYYIGEHQIYSAPFFKSLMQAQMFQITGAQKISIPYKKFGISPKLFWLVKNIAVARILICNLFCESKNTRFFAAKRRHFIRRNDEFMSAVLHRLLANFALLILR